MLHQLLLWLCAHTLFVTICGQKSNKAYHYDAYGHFYGAYNVSPEGVFGRDNRISSHWLHSITGPHGDAGKLLKAFNDPHFAEVALYGALRDHIAILSKVLCVVLAGDGRPADIDLLQQKLSGLLRDRRRPELFKRAFPEHRIGKIQKFFLALDIKKREDARAALAALRIGSLKEYEGPLVERIFLLMLCHWYGREGASPTLLANALHFHYQTYVFPSMAWVVGTQLTPDVPLILAHILWKSCELHKDKVRDDRLPWSTYLEKWVYETASRGDLTEAIAFEIDGIAGQEGRRCLASTMKTYTVQYDRAAAFPTYPLAGKRPHLRHAPMSMSGWEVMADAYGAQFKPGRALVRTKPELRSIGLGIDLNQRGSLLAIKPEGGRFSIVHLQQNSGARQPHHRGDDTSGSPEDHLWSDESGAEETGDTDNFSSTFTNPFRATFRSRAAKHNWPDTILKTSVCDRGLQCNIEVQRGDIVLVYRAPGSDPDSDESLPQPIADAIVNAAYGSKREALLQLAATIPCLGLYHVVLVEA